MRTKKTELYVHLIWSAWGGEPALAGLDQSRLYEFIQEIAAQMSVEALAVGGTDNHLHLLARIPSTLPVDHLAAHLKAAAAQHVSHALPPETRFRWAANYAAFTVSKSETADLAEYIRRQPEIHAGGQALPAREMD
ncbi:transposase [Capsulimonas corticalis]|uniref:Transposase n=1 Tax=Capsulimonas corticalis TaxID=2219043 RepID=A0A402D355_9BACT|nr:transposase [Capsulimonas corticalis]BDI28338.1 transposase [Capsulimonas corticalis]